MKATRLLLAAIGILLLTSLGTGCIPPPPHQHPPKPATPPGGPAAIEHSIILSVNC
ncbi:MAG TPA: hypothetical protein VKU83_06970 [Puia sp.]|nr:hypothetical protein [Puia sp.]